jgi:hypothetical protein
MSAIKNTTTTTRPDTSAPFWSYSQAVKDHVKAAYEDTGKYLTGMQTVSEDKLTKVRTVIWSSAEAQDEFLMDPMIRESFLTRKAYNILHNHTSEFSNTPIDLNPDPDADV